jgi:hypothetical protein
MRNIQTAADLGMSVIYINENRQPSLLYPSIRYLKELPMVLSTGGELRSPEE